jgi:hypothetical protein
MSTSSTPNLADSSQELSPGKVKTIVRRFKTQIRKGLSPRHSRSSSRASLDMSSSTSLPTASTVLDDPESISAKATHHDSQPRQRSNGSINSSGSTVVDDLELSKAPLAESSADVSRGLGMEESLISISEGKQPGVEVDLPIPEQPETESGRAEDGERIISASPVGVDSEVPDPPIPQVAPYDLSTSRTLGSEGPSSEKTRPVIAISDPSPSAVPGSIPSPTSSPASLPRGEKGASGLILPGLVALTLTTPYPQLSFSIRIIPLSFLLLWYLCKV